MIRGFQVSTDELVAFPVERIMDNTVTDFDLFLTISDHMILYGHQGYRWEKSELEALLKYGHTHLLARKKDAPRVLMYEQLARLPQAELDLAPAKRITSIEKIGAAFTQCLYEGDLTKACVVKAGKISDALTQCILEDPTCVQALSSLVNHDEYVYHHSIRVASYAVAIAVELGLTNVAKLQEIALGGIFHDIGKRDVGLDIINKRGPLNTHEWKVMRAHPMLGHQAIQKTMLSHVPREIILHHHEKPDGSGYPDGLDKNSILPEVEIASLADVYDALTSSRAYQAKRNTYETLDFIKHRIVSKKLLEPDIYLALVRCLSR